MLIKDFNRLVFVGRKKETRNNSPVNWWPQIEDRETNPKYLSFFCWQNEEFSFKNGLQPKLKKQLERRLHYLEFHFTDIL